MKHLNLICCLFLAFGASKVHADTAITNGVEWTYYVDDGKVTISGIPQSTYGSIEIPSELGGYPVTGIRNYAFQGCSGLTNVTIPDSVTCIGDWAFCYCSGLTSVTIGNGVTSIGDYAFSHCSESLFDTETVPGVKLVDGWAVGNTGTLSGVPDLTGIRGIGPRAFAGCRGLTSVTIPDGVINIGTMAFADCSSLTSITIPGSVIEIDERAFEGCSGLVSVYISDLASWCRISFIGNNSENPLCYAQNLYVAGKLLRRLTIPDGVTEIKPFAFYNYGKLTSVTIPDTVTNIGDYAFYGCSSLASVTMGNEVTNIGEKAFYGCSALMNMPIGNKVTDIGDYAFFNCSSLTNVTIPDSVTNIGYGVFQNCTVLSDVTLSKNLRSVKDFAFDHCWRLASVIMPEGVTSVGQYAFWDCYNITNVTFGRSVTHIGDQAFYYCLGLECVTIPSNVTSIGSDAFRSCNGLSEVNIEDVSSWCSILFGNIDANPLSQAHHLYMDGEEITGLVIPDGVERIEDFAFSGATGLKWAVIPASVESIGYQAFAGCSDLERVYFLGDAPETDGDIFSGASGALTVYAAEGTTGWNYAGSPALPDAWPVDDGDNARSIVNGTIEDPIYADVTFDANGGDMGGAASSISVIRGRAIGALPVPTLDGHAFAGWWTAADGGEQVTSATIVRDALTLVARWEVTPFTFGGSADWTRVGGGVWRSGVIGNGEESWLQLDVSGSGHLSFRWKASSEMYKTTPIDYAVFSVDGEVRTLPIGGETEWADVAMEIVGGGVHSLRWTYRKDEADSAGEDCAWIDAVMWTPDETVDVGGVPLTVPGAWLSEVGCSASDIAANGRTVAECYALGLDPTIATNDFRIVSFWMDGDNPMLEWEPKTNRWTGDEIKATLKGALNLHDKDWTKVTDENKALFRFFKVEVELP